MAHTQRASSTSLQYSGIRYPTGYSTLTPWTWVEHTSNAYNLPLNMPILQQKKAALSKTILPTGCTIVTGPGTLALAFDKLTVRSNITL